jgi:hypothetical protein
MASCMVARSCMVFYSAQIYSRVTLDRLKDRADHATVQISRVRGLVAMVFPDPRNIPVHTRTMGKNMLDRAGFGGIVL